MQILCRSEVSRAGRNVSLELSVMATQTQQCRGQVRVLSVSIKVGAVLMLVFSRVYSVD